MTRFKHTLCAVMLTVGISSSVFAGNIGGMRTTSAGNIGGMHAEFPVSETIFTMIRLLLETSLF